MDGGRPRLTQLTLPRARLVLGPSQVSRQILATPAVGNRLRLLNQETADLGSQAVNAVELSEPRVVPIGDSFLYVQPIYVTAQGSGVTRVRLVTVYLNGRVGYGKTLSEALRVAQGRHPRRRHPEARRWSAARRARGSPAPPTTGIEREEGRKVDLDQLGRGFGTSRSYRSTTRLTHPRRLETAVFDLHRFTAAAWASSRRGVSRTRTQGPRERRNGPPLRREDVHREHQIPERQRRANRHTRNRQLGREQHEHQHRVAASEA